MSPSDAFSELAQEALTDDQRDVVRDLGHGPIKVVAAAGSGKTTTMAWLYAAALVDQVPQGQIMAVTFTERAAAELRRKVLEVMVQARLAPADSTAQQLDGAWIGTFHQLVRRLLGERAYLAGLPRDLELLDEVEAGMVMEEAVAQVRQQTAAASWLEHLPLDPDPRTVLNLVAGARSTVYRLRSTELTPGRCAALSEEAYAEAEALGDPVEQIAWHRAALRLTLALWEEYERRLLQRHAVDFDGLLREGLLALRRSPRLLGWCRANFRLVIVDEYQDTSALQESLIHELTGPDHQTLFTVGDARQSIYAFRDAKPGIMAEAPGRTRELFLNRRSRADILAAADHLIKGDPDFADDQPMVAHRKVEPSLPVFYAEVEDPVREAEAIAAALEQLHRDGITYPDSSHQPVSWRDMAILAYTQSRVGAPLEEALRRRGIPFQTATGGLLDRPEVRDLLSFVRLAGDDRDDLACLRLLQSPVGRVPDQALAQLSAPGRRTGRTLAERVRAHLAAGAPGWDRAWADRTALLLGVVERLRLAAGTARAGELVSRALAESGLLQLEEARARSGAPGGRRALASLRELQRIVWGVESPHRWLTLAGLLARLELMQAGARTAEPPPETDEDLVTLSTIHRAKGLEWPVVVLADCRPFHRQGGDAVLWDRRAQAVICTRLAAGQPTAARTRWGESPDAKVDRD
ncbi:MAG TPA: ATP-dependent helicase, partial [Candidatus Dormibacteraeota bacterium]